jgi:hypothetical protein
VVNDATVAKNNCVFTDMDSFIYQSNSTLTSSTFRRCGLVTQGGSTITSCSFDSPTGAIGLSVDSLVDVTDCSFTSDGTGHAIDLGTVSATGSISWSNNDSGYASSNGSTGNETILVSVATSQTLTINVGVGSSTPTIYNTGAGTVLVVSGQVDVSVTTTTPAGVPVGDVRVILRAADATGDFPYHDVITIVNSGTTATATHTAHGMASGDYVDIHGASLNQNNGVFIITVTGVDTYTYTMISDPGASPTGTIESTFVALYGVTNTTTGVLTTSRGYSTAQPVQGIARKSSGAPYYKTAPIVGTVSTTNGFSGTGIMILDQ